MIFISTLYQPRHRITIYYTIYKKNFNSFAVETLLFPLNFSKLDTVNSIEEKKKIKERKYPPLNSRGLVVNHERAAGGPGAALVAGEIFYRRCGVSCRLNRNLYANPRNLGFSVRPPHKHRDYAIKTGSPFRPVARETFS